MAVENGTVAKLVSLRQSFLASVEEARAQFVGRIKGARESYISQIVDVALGDPRLSGVEKALNSWNQPTPQPATQPVAASGINTSSGVPGMVPLPEKWPMKRNIARIPTVYGTCPSCNHPVFEPQAKFCSYCAYPLEEP